MANETKSGRGDRHLRVLLTIIGFAWRSGSETNVRDLALSLLKRGHTVTIFAPTLGDLAWETRRRGVAVVDRLDDLAEGPDIIHGNHVIPFAEALVAFPDTPAVWTCHDWLAWHDEPPTFPQILRHTAVDETCRERLIQAGVPRKRTVLTPNAVDLSRIPARPDPLPPKARTALAFGKAVAALEALDQGCWLAGVKLEALGPPATAVSADPEQELVRHDIVIATARAASEALAGGSAVILADARGFGGMVTSRNYKRLRDLNFGIRTLTEPVTPQAIAHAVGQYDAADAERVARRHCAERNLDRTARDIERLYRQVVTENRTREPDPEGWKRALMAYLRQFTPHGSPDARWPWERERLELLKRIDALERRLIVPSGDQM